MQTLTEKDFDYVGGGISPGVLWAATLPVRGVAAAGMLGWAVGSAIYRTYDVQIQAGLDRLLR